MLVTEDLPRMVGANRRKWYDRSATPEVCFGLFCLVGRKGEREDLLICLWLCVSFSGYLLSSSSWKSGGGGGDFLILNSSDFSDGAES